MFNDAPAPKPAPQAQAEPETRSARSKLMVAPDAMESVVPVYANHVHIVSTEEEVYMIFVLAKSHAPGEVEGIEGPVIEGLPVGGYILSKAHAKRLQQALGRVLKD